MKVSFNSPMPGKISEVCVKEGDKIKKGEILVILESMKMLNELLAEKDGTVVSVKVKAGDFTPVRGILLEIEV
jgi:biotin carboxyl carrier protein